MNGQSLTSVLAASATQAPASAAIYAVQPFALDELRTRASGLLALLTGQDDSAGACRSDRADWKSDDSQTTITLPQGARAVLYHASGAIDYRSGLAPFAASFAQPVEREGLIRQLTERAARLELPAWLGEQGSLSFERLWQMKAQGSDRTGKNSEVLLTRAVGAWRHAVAGIAVLGAASVALRLAGDGTVDAFSLRIRPSAAETVDTATTIAPELAARQLAQHLASLLGNGRDELPPDAIAEARMLFGYLDLGKRKAQQVLAPSYVAQITVVHKFERQAYVLAVPATERSYQQLQVAGNEGLATGARRGC
ncbi:hypothetical protein [Massilia sp. DWR3-1-1]|uniref:hypothetical protein n=1 Tax=Massilia sp. DWR3-1-1 TaxID=2804559 RepID=UPI003CF7973A